MGDNDPDEFVSVSFYIMVSFHFPPFGLAFCKSSIRSWAFYCFYHIFGYWGIIWCIYMIVYSVTNSTAISNSIVVCTLYVLSVSKIVFWLFSWYKIKHFLDPINISFIKYGREKWNIKKNWCDDSSDFTTLHSLFI